MKTTKMPTFLMAILFCVFASKTNGNTDVVYPKIAKYQQLATRLHCQVEEAQHFRYSSTAKLWGIMGGEIVVNADVTLHCLGDDRGGKYESEALKYKAVVSNLVIEEKSGAGRKEPEESLRRRKRGVGEFFTDAWDKVKRFFKKVFRIKTEQPQVTNAEDDSVDKRKGVSAEEEDEEEFNMNDIQKLYSVPFLFVQLANGSIPEIRFAENEIEDGRIKNFKRHLVDAFATHLDSEQNQKSVVESSVMGEHTSSYDITVNDEKATLNMAGWASSSPEEPTVVVNKVVTENDILKLAPSEAPNDRDKMELKLQQRQIFQGGKLLSSSGTSTVALLQNPSMKSNRKKRETEFDVLAYFQAHSTFEMKLNQNIRRFPRSSARLEREKPTNYSTSSREAEAEDSSDRQKVRSFQQSTGDMSTLLKDLLENQRSDYDEKMQIMCEMVEKEVNLNLDRESQSTSMAVRKLLTKQKMLDMCTKNFTICKDFLQLLALAGGPDAENVLLSLLTEKNTLSSLDKRSVADILSDVSKPSSGLFNTLSQIITENLLENDVLGSVCLGSASMGFKAEDSDKQKISRTLINQLRERMHKCHSDILIVDILEAIGNLGCEHTVPYVLQVAENCRQNGGIQIASAHALRHFSHLPVVQTWLRNVTIKGDCEITEAVVGALLDKIQEQEMSQDTTNWPRYGFNEVDQILKDNLEKSRCSVKDTVLYFRKKKNAEANYIAENYYEPETEPWNPGSNSRQKRALWDDLNCNEWVDDNKYTPIQGEDEFASDRETYNRRRSCLAFRKLGVRGASAEIYAGMFAGVQEPSEPPKYKLFTKFVSGLNFLGHEMEIGSFYFYHHSGRTKAYVRIMGKTRQEFTHDGCTPTDLKYRPLKHIPLYLFSISTVQMSLGIHLSSQLSLDTGCPGKEVYQLEPMTNVRIGGEAMGTVLVIRGAVNLSGDFNYKMRFTFTPTPNMCLKGSHGYDPMHISFEAFYQLWNVAKSDWGKSRTWKPSFLSWDVKHGNLKSWFDDTCILSNDQPPSSNSERELE